MEFKASHMYAPVTARKARLVIDVVRGLKVNAAIEALQTLHRRAGPMVSKVIKSAIANAGQAKAIDKDSLYVKTALVNEGPLKQGRMRWKPGPMGRIRPIRKRTSHIHITLGVLDETSGRKEGKGKKAASK